jgi:hypothetical protein
MIRFLIVAGLAACLGGCSTVFPLPSFIAHDDVTGSIPKAPSPLSKRLDAEDWRRAHAALGVALDPQGNGASVAWDNPQSGLKGTFVPVGDAYPRDDRICRVFLAEIGVQNVERVQGTGCRDKSGDWAVSDVKPKPKA